MQINILKMVGCTAACIMSFSSFAASPNLNKTGQAVIPKPSKAKHSTKITFLGQPVQVASTSLVLNEKAPQVELVDPDFKAIKVGGATGTTQVIASVVSLNNPVCAKEVSDLESFVSKFPKVQFIVVSKGLPFAMGAYAKKNDIKNIQFASDFRNDDFGNAYGTLITSGLLKGLNARAIFVVNAKGDLIYKEEVNEIATPPHYETLKLALKSVYNAPKAAS